MSDIDSQNELKRIVYVDMDGVICDFDGAFYAMTGISTDNVNDDEMWSQIAAHGKVRFFSEMPWMSGGKELWSFVNDNFLQVKILTALGRSDASDGGQTSRGKRMWLRTNIPSMQDSDIIMVANRHKKKQYSKPGDIIIDDNQEVIQGWLKKGGIGILHKTTPETIGQLKQYV